MVITEIIEKKKQGLELSKEEINFFIDGYCKDIVKDYQASSLLMAICLKGMNERETFDLTEAMLNSGDIVSLKNIPGIKVDKHSTGGVGDKTSLALLPLVCSDKVKVAKMSGRGLGHTGGTIDKLESIPNFKVNLSLEEFEKQVNDISIAIIAQTGNLVPADKKLYALRDVTATVDNLSLIASSIMSKKLASNADTILLDVKFGSGAFMKTLPDARKLASLMVKIGTHFNKNTIAVITDMDQPLGTHIGNRLELIESLETLQGRGSKDFHELIIKLGGIILYQAKEVTSFEEGEKIIQERINNGYGLKKLFKMVSSQHGDVSFLDKLMKEGIDKTKYIIEIKAPRDGYVVTIDALKIGEASLLSGAGRKTKEDTIDFDAGIILNKKINDYCKKGDTLLTIFTNVDEHEDACALALDAYRIVDKPIKTKPLIYEVVSNEG